MAHTVQIITNIFHNLDLFVFVAITKQNPRYVPVGLPCIHFRSTIRDSYKTKHIYAVVFSNLQTLRVKYDSLLRICKYFIQNLK